MANLEAFLELIKMDVLSESDREKLTEEIQTEVKNSQKILSNLLAWGKSQQLGNSHKPEKLNLKSLLTEQVEDAAFSAEAKNVTFNLEVPNERAEVYADFHQVEMIVRNLIHNGLKFSYPNSEIDLTLEVKGNQVEVTIRDHGKGIDEEKLTAILNREEFYSTTGTAGEKGNGIGLNLVQNFIALNKGNFQIKNAEGAGTKSWFSLPTPTKFS